MFRAVAAKIIEVNGATAVIRTVDGDRIDVLRRFDFDHHRMTQSVIARVPDGRLLVLAKGSGENVFKICDPVTIPMNYQSTLDMQAKKGKDKTRATSLNFPSSTA